LRRFYEGHSEIEISGELEDRAANKTVSRPRIKLYLFMESDLKPPFEKQEFVKLAYASLSIKEIERKAGSRLLRHLRVKERIQMPGGCREGRAHQTL
jgi:hypothetical protein